MVSIRISFRLFSLVNQVLWSPKIGHQVGKRILFSFNIFQVFLLVFILFVAVKANQFFINNISKKKVFPQLFFLPCGFKEPLVDSKVLSLKGERRVLLLTIPLRQLVSGLSQQAWVRWLIYQTMATSSATMIVKEWLFRELNEKISNVKTNKHCVICRQQSDGQRAHHERVPN